MPNPAPCLFICTLPAQCQQLAADTALCGDTTPNIWARSLYGTSHSNSTWYLGLQRYRRLHLPVAIIYALYMVKPSPTGLPYPILPKRVVQSCRILSTHCYCQQPRYTILEIYNL
ncbi:uncharacterized protein LOC143768967 [Ranitomeya variabilis]|uniref:uncharacterized protein LOC143768966 n=1 Tax=Ranitomeya variabilis TaxID=490064 RepID=UPI004055A323